MWMWAQTAVNDMFEIKINELECFLSQREKNSNESDRRCQDQILQTKAACSFIQQGKNTLKIFSLKKNKTKSATERKIELYCVVKKKKKQGETQNPICRLSGKQS